MASTVLACASGSRVDAASCRLTIRELIDQFVDALSLILGEARQLRLEALDGSCWLTGAPPLHHAVQALETAVEDPIQTDAVGLAIVEQRLGHGSVRSSEEPAISIPAEATGPCGPSADKTTRRQRSAGRRLGL